MTIYFLLYLSNLGFLWQLVFSFWMLAWWKVITSVLPNKDSLLTGKSSLPSFYSQLQSRYTEEKDKINSRWEERDEKTEREEKNGCVLLIESFATQHILQKYCSSNQVATQPLHYQDVNCCDYCWSLSISGGQNISEVILNISSASETLKSLYSSNWIIQAEALKSGFSYFLP